MGKRDIGRPAGLERWQQIQAASRYSGDDFALFTGSAESALSQLPDASVNTVLTSPPYWSVRDYEHSGQLGLEPELEDYVERLVKVFREVHRVLTLDGSAWLNIGDTYFGKSVTVNGKPPATGWKRQKQLSLVPFRVAIALEEEGWWVRNVAVWHKTNAMPSSVQDRLTNAWEPVFLLTKSPHYFFNLDSVRIPHTTSDMIERDRAIGGNAKGKAEGKKELRRWLNSPRHRATIDGVKNIERRPNAPEAVVLAAFLKMALKTESRSIKWVAEELDLPFERTRHYFRTDEIGSRLPPPEVWDRLKPLLNLTDEFDDAMAVESGDNIFRNHPLGRNPGDVQSIAVSPSVGDHFAVMPEKLARFALRTTLPTNGVVLDPFMGSGTTGLVARELGGRFVGIDLKVAYMKEYLKSSGYRGK